METNRWSGEENVVRKAGQVQVSAGLSEHNSMEADGSWNDFTVEAFGTVDILVNNAAGFGGGAA